MAHKRYVDFISGSALDALIRGKAREITVGGTSAGNAIQVNALQRKKKTSMLFSCVLLVASSIARQAISQTILFN
jgi:predicted TIM-barrel enzyme